MRRKNSDLQETRAKTRPSIDETIRKLRAYAAIAIGDEDTGDVALVRALNKLLDETENGRAKPGLNYHAFAFELLETELRTLGAADTHVRRKAYVLTEIEGLSPTETAQILGRDPTEIISWTDEIEIPASICPSCLRPWAECGVAGL